MSAERFEREVARHRPAVLAAARRLTRSADEAEDLAQEAIVRAMRGFDRFELGTNFQAWILRIVTNLYINRYRAARRRPVEPWNDALDDLATPEEDSPERLVLVGELSDEVEAALAAMPGIFARVVVLVDAQGMGHDEVALAEGVPMGTVRSRLHRGRMILRASLAGYSLREGYRRVNEAPRPGG